MEDTSDACDDSLGYTQVGIIVDECISNGTISAQYTCSSSTLTAMKYAGADCAGNATETIVAFEDEPCTTITCSAPKIATLIVHLLVAAWVAVC